MSVVKYREVEGALWSWAGLKVDEGFVHLPRLGVRVRVQEVGEGPPALFIHGGPNSGSTWAPLLAHLDGFRCLVLDRPGTGLSDPFPVRKENVVEFASHLVADVLDGLGIERAHVVASSFGGYCALWSAAQTPERFDRMVQMAAPALLPDQTLPPFMKMIMVPGMRKIIAALPPNAKAQNSILRQIGHGASLDADKLPKPHGDWYMALLRHTATMRNDFDTFHSFKAKGGLATSIALGGQTLATISTPTHFIWGADDGFGGEAVARWVVGVMSNASLEMVPDSGHLPWLDEPELVARSTRTFLLAGSPVSERSEL